MHDALAQAKQDEHKAEIEKELGAIPLLATAVSECRQRYLEQAAEAKQSQKPCRQPVHLDCKQRKDALAQAAAAAAQKTRDAAAAKAQQAEQRAAEREKAIW